MKLSLIICVYNTAHALLEECLASIYSEVGSEKFEVVFVDDGSTADYTDLIKKYPVRYEKIENRGHLGARLYGISVASGDYVGFVDSDDSVSKNYHSPMLDVAEKSGTDIIINGWAFHTERTKRICTRDTTMSTDIDLRDDDCLRAFAAQRGREHSYFVLWNKIYKKSLIKTAASELENLIPTDKRITYGEDVLLNFLCFKSAKSVKNVNSGLYFYRIHGAQSVIAETEEKIKSQINCMSRVFEIMLSLSENHIHSGTVKSDIEEWQANMSRTHYSKAKAQKLISLYPIIKTAYGVEKLQMPTFSDGWFYAASELLGDNFENIDAALTSLYYQSKPIEAKYERKSRYVGRIISYASAIDGDIIYSSDAEICVPKRKISLRDKIIHSPLVYRIGLIFFKKGSKIRAFLKKHL